MYADVHNNVLAGLVSCTHCFGCGLANFQVPLLNVLTLKYICSVVNAYVPTMLVNRHSL